MDFRPGFTDDMKKEAGALIKDASEIDKEAAFRPRVPKKLPKTKPTRSPATVKALNPESAGIQGASTPQEPGVFEGLFGAGNVPEFLQNPGATAAKGLVGGGAAGAGLAAADNATDEGGGLRFTNGGISMGGKPGVIQQVGNVAKGTMAGMAAGVPLAFGAKGGLPMLKKLLQSGASKVEAGAASTGAAAPEAAVAKATKKTPPVGKGGINSDPLDFNPEQAIAKSIDDPAFMNNLGGKNYQTNARTALEQIKDPKELQALIDQVRAGVIDPATLPYSLQQHLKIPLETARWNQSYPGRFMNNVVDPLKNKVVDPMIDNMLVPAVNFIERTARNPTQSIFKGGSVDSDLLKLAAGTAIDSVLDSPMTNLLDNDMLSFQPFIDAIQNNQQFIPTEQLDTQKANANAVSRAIGNVQATHEEYDPDARGYLSSGLGDEPGYIHNKQEVSNLEKLKAYLSRGSIYPGDPYTAQPHTEQTVMPFERLNELKRNIAQANKFNRDERGKGDIMQHIPSDDNLMHGAATLGGLAVGGLPGMAAVGLGAGALRHFGPDIADNLDPVFRKHIPGYEPIPSATRHNLASNINYGTEIDNKHMDEVRALVGDMPMPKRTQSQTWSDERQGDAFRYNRPSAGRNRDNLRAAIAQGMRSNMTAPSDMPWMDLPSVRQDIPINRPSKRKLPDR